MLDKYTCEALWPSLRFLIHKRRQALHRNDLERHRSYTFQFIEEEDMCRAERLLGYILGHFDISEDQYLRSFVDYKKNDSDKNYDIELAQMIVNLRRRELRKNENGLYLIKPRDLKELETKQIFEAQSKLTEEAFANQQ